jgi:hypothetical protein
VDEATDVIAVSDLSSPVFVDASGRRGRRIRIVFSVLGAATLVYGALVATSLAGGPLKPQQLVPFPDLVNNLPVLDQQQPAAQPGAKNTPAAKSTAGTAKKITTTGKPAQSGVVPVPSASAPAPGGPGPDTTTTPPVEATDAPPTTQPSATPTTRPTPTPTRTAEPTSTPTPTPTSEGTATAMPMETRTAGVGQTPGTVPVGETDTGRPGATPIASSVGGGGTVATPTATASLGTA